MYAMIFCWESGSGGGEPHQSLCATATIATGRAWKEKDEWNHSLFPSEPLSMAVAAVAMQLVFFARLGPGRGTERQRCHSLPLKLLQKGNQQQCYHHLSFSPHTLAFLDFPHYKTGHLYSPINSTPSNLIISLGLK